MRQKTPTSDKRQGLDDDSQKINSSTNPIETTSSCDGHKVLDQIAQKWADRGYYPTPGRALRALIGGAQ